MENRSGEGKTRQAMLLGVCKVALVVITLSHTVLNKATNNDRISVYIADILIHQPVIFFYLLIM